MRSPVLCGERRGVAPRITRKLSIARTSTPCRCPIGVHLSRLIIKIRTDMFLLWGSKRSAAARTTAVTAFIPVLQGRRLRLRSPERIVDELEILRHEFDIRSVHFTDAVVNQPQDHLRAICNEILRRRLEIGWTGFFREDTLSEKELDLYRKAGLLTVYFSADGASDFALKLLGKDLTMEQVLHAGKLAAQSGILTVYHFLVNLPGESRASVDQAYGLLDRLFSLHASKGNLGAVVINNLRLYPGTPLTEKILRDRLIDPDTTFFTRFISTRRPGTISDMNWRHFA